MRSLSLWILSAALIGGVSAQAKSATALDTALIEQATGLKAQSVPKEGVIKVMFPREDLKVMAGGVHITPPLGLTCWAAFTPAGKEFMVMGDLVLTEGQVNPVLSAALNNGLEVTALHNHFFGDQPRVMFMHIGGRGSQEELAQAVGQVFATIRQSAGATFPTASIDPAQSTFDAKKIDAILGVQGQLGKGVYKVAFGRETKMHGARMGNAMGINTWAAFAGTDQQAVVDGDFVMLAGEVQNVLKALRQADINIVALHNHMISEDPRIYFLHYWGIGPVERLANGLKAALAQTAR